MKILFKAVVRNCEKWIPLFRKICEKCEKVFDDIEFSYYIFENDSSDNTKWEIAKNFDWYHMADYGYVFGDDMKSMRMAKCRRMAKDMCNINYDIYDYILLIDSGVNFSEETLLHLITTLRHNQSVVMACPRSYGNSITDKYGFKKIPDYNTHELIPVKSCMDGLALIRAWVYEYCDWIVHHPCDSEHETFCWDASMYGKIVIVPYAIKNKSLKFNNNEGHSFNIGQK